MGPFSSILFSFLIANASAISIPFRLTLAFNKKDKRKNKPFLDMGDPFKRNAFENYKALLQGYFFCAASSSFCLS